MVVKYGAFALVGLAVGAMLGYRFAPSTTGPVLGSPKVAAAAELPCHLSPGGGTEPLLRLNERSVTFKDLPPALKGRYVRLYEELQLRRQAMLEDLGLRLMLSKELDAQKGLDTLPELDELLGAKIEIDDKELAQFYETNKQGFPAGSSFESIKPTLADHLRTQRIARQAAELRSALRANKNFALLASPLCPPEIPVDLSGRLAIGKESAGAVVLYAASYFCPTCRAAWPQIETVLREHADTYRIYPIALVDGEDTPEGELARGAFCAGKLGGAVKLGEYHRAAFRTPLELRNVPDKLAAHARGPLAEAAHLAAEEFAACLTSDDARRALRADKALAAELGVDRVPALFINGRRVVASSGGEDELAATLKRLALAASPDRS
jgi:protein-disulfide isomerase